MKVKTFTGSTIHEALTAVKNDMGDSVLILDTRTRVSVGLGGVFGKKIVEVIVADDTNGDASANPSTVMGVGTKRRWRPEEGPRDYETTGPQDRGTVGPWDRGTVGPQDQEIPNPLSNHESPAPPAIGNRQSAIGNPLPPTVQTAIPQSQLPAVLQRVYDLDATGQAAAPMLPTQTVRQPGAGVCQSPHFAHLTKDAGTTDQKPDSRITDYGLRITDTTPTPRIYHSLAEHLRKQDVPEPFIRALIDHLLLTLGPNAAGEALYTQLKQMLTSFVRVEQVQDRENPRSAGPAGQPRSKEDEEDLLKILDNLEDIDPLSQSAKEKKAGKEAPPATIVAFVGSAGAGKTTALVKLAAHLANQKMRSVGLISIEPLEGAAASPLNAFAELMGVSVRRVKTPAQLVQAIEAFSDRAYVFIDTPGCALQANGHQAFSAASLQPFLAAAPGLQTHLVLSATTRLRDLAAAVRAFGPLGARRLIFTRLDETDAWGHLLALARDTKLPIAYFSHGQAIPEDLKPAMAEDLVEHVLGRNA